MVGDDQAAAFAVCRLYPLDLDADVEDGQQLPAPGFEDVPLSGSIQVRVGDRQQQAVNKVQATRLPRNTLTSMSPYRAYP